MSSVRDRVVYHESQESGFCGLHSINNVLQGPYFTVFDLSNIAIELDKEEQALLLGPDADPAFVNALSQDENGTGNVCLDGNFSIQVLRKALNTFSLDMVRMNSEEGQALQQVTPLEQQQAFICNFNDHWFGIRKIKGKFYNLDSLKKKPAIVSDTYLSLFLNQLTIEGYDIFILAGELPPIDGSKMGIDSHGAWWDIDSIGSGKKPNSSTTIRVMSEPIDDDLRMALALSMNPASPPNRSPSPSSPVDPELELAIKMSMEMDK